MKEGIKLLLVLILLSRTVLGFTQETDVKIHLTPDSRIYELSDLEKPKFCNESNGYFVVITPESKALIIDLSGEIVGTFPNCLSGIIQFDKNGHAIAAQGDWGDWHPRLVIINTKGEVIKELAKNVVLYSQYFSDGIGYYAPNYDKSYFFDTNGHILKDVSIDVFWPEFGLPKKKDGLRLITSNNRPDKFINDSFEVVIESDYQTHEFSEGLAAVSKRFQAGFRWGFINTKGETVIDYKFTNEPGDFHDGFAPVHKSNGSVCYIDKNGNACSPEYHNASNFCKGYAIISLNEWPYPYYIIDKTFNTIAKVNISDFYRLRGNEKLNIFYHPKGIFTLTGNKIWENSSRGVENNEGDLMHISDNGICLFKYCYINEKRYTIYKDLEGNIIAAFTKSEF